MAITQSQRQSILQDLSQGSSLRQACRNADISDPIQVRRLVDADEQFASQYARAREDGYTLLADDLLEVSDNLDLPADHKRTMVDSRKWLLSKMLPKIYGDRLDLTAKVTTNQQLTKAELMAIAAQAKTPGGDS